MAARMAMAPSSGALRAERVPINLPMGVRAALRMTGSFRWLPFVLIIFILLNPHARDTARPRACVGGYTFRQSIRGWYGSRRWWSCNWCHQSSAEPRAGGDVRLYRPLLPFPD